MARPSPPEREMTNPHGTAGGGVGARRPAARRGRGGSRLLVLGWHNVGPTPTWPFPEGAGMRGFEQQLDAIGRVADVVPLGEALDTLARGGRLPRRAVAITFDDGYRDNLELAVPALERRGMPATFFLVPGLLSREVEAWWERSGWAVNQATVAAGVWGGEPRPDQGELMPAYVRKVHESLKTLDRDARERRVAQLEYDMRPGTPFPEDLFLDWDGARHLADRGFEIGSHTYTHPILSRETPDVQVEELTTAREALEAGLGRPVPLLAYPNGSTADYDEATLMAVRAAGYRFAITTRWGWNTAGTPPLEIRRLVVPVRAGVKGLVRALAGGLHQLRTPA